MKLFAHIAFRYAWWLERYFSETAENPMPDNHCGTGSALPCVDKCCEEIKKMTCNSSLMSFFTYKPVG